MFECWALSASGRTRRLSSHRNLVEANSTRRYHLERLPHLIRVWVQLNWEERR